jgi:hypothetical protein
MVFWAPRRRSSLAAICGRGKLGHVGYANEIVWTNQKLRTRRFRAFDWLRGYDVISFAYVNKSMLGKGSQYTWHMQMTLIEGWMTPALISDGDAQGH